MHYNIPYLIIGLVTTFAVPLGMLHLAIKWAERIDKNKNKK